MTVLLGTHHGKQEGFLFFVAEDVQPLQDWPVAPCTQYNWAIVVENEKKNKCFKEKYAIFKGFRISAKRNGRLSKEI